MTTLIALALVGLTAPQQSPPPDASDWKPSYTFTNLEEVSPPVAIGVPMDPAEAKKLVEGFAVNGGSPMTRIVNGGRLTLHTQGAPYAKYFKLTFDGKIERALEFCGPEEGAGKVRPLVGPLNNVLARVVVNDTTGQREMWFRCRATASNKSIYLFLSEVTESTEARDYSISFYDPEAKVISRSTQGSIKT